MTLLSLKSLFSAPKPQPKPWLVGLTLTALIATGLVIANLDHAQLQAERADIVQQVAEQSAELAEAQSANAALGKQIDAVRDTIAEHETILSSTAGLLP